MDYRSDRKIWLTEMDGLHWLLVDDHTSFPLTLKQYEENPHRFAFDIIDEMSADTTFKIVKCIKQEDPFNATGYRLSVVVTEGKYVGETFAMFASDVFENIGDENGNDWKLHNYIKPQ